MAINVNNYQNAAKWLSSKSSVTLKEGNFVKDRWNVKVKKFFSPKFRRAEKKKVIAYLREKITATKNLPAEQRAGIVALGNAFILKNKKSKKVHKSLLKLDHLMGKIRKTKGDRYLMKTNILQLKKWKRNGQDENIFQNHYDFIKYAFDTPLASQIKVTRDVIAENAKGEVVIPVELQRIEKDTLVREQKAMPFHEFKLQFSCVEDKTNKERVFVDHSGNIHTYLDTDKGMVMHDAYQAALVPPQAISNISQEEYKRTLGVARKFVRKGEKDPSKNNNKRDYILQVVTSYVDSKHNNPLTENFKELLTRRKHPYIRIITPEGNVYEVGFYKNKSVFPLSIGSGQFRSPDKYEYLKVDERVVTNIAIDSEEKDSFYQYVSSYQNLIRLGKKPAFHWLRQNCSVFVRGIVKCSTGIDLPTQTTFSNFLYRIAPTFIQKIGQGLTKAKKAFSEVIIKPLPKWIKKTGRWVINIIKRIWSAFKALLLSVVSFLGGGAFGPKGQKFKQKAHEQQKDLAPHLQNPLKWVDEKKYRVNLPGILQEWQRKQASTVVFKNPVRFAIVPPQEEAKS